MKNQKKTIEPQRITLREAAKRKRTSAMTISRMARDGVLRCDRAHDSTGHERVTAIYVDDAFDAWELFPRGKPKLRTV